MHSNLHYNGDYLNNKVLLAARGFRFSGNYEILSIDWSGKVFGDFHVYCKCRARSIGHYHVIIVQVEVYHVTYFGQSVRHI